MAMGWGSRAQRSLPSWGVHRCPHYGFLQNMGRPDLGDLGMPWHREETLTVMFSAPADGSFLAKPRLVPGKCRGRTGGQRRELESGQVCAWWVQIINRDQGVQSQRLNQKDRVDPNSHPVWSSQSPDTSRIPTHTCSWEEAADFLLVPPGALGT